MPMHAKWPKRKSEVTVKFGEPMSFGTTKNYLEVTERLRRAVEELVTESRRRAAGPARR